jgi:hypothetical protein
MLFAAIAHSRFWHEREVPMRTAKVGCDWVKQT